MQQIAVGAVQLDPIEPESHRPPGGRDEGRADARKPALIERGHRKSRRRYFFENDGERDLLA